MKLIVGLGNPGDEYTKTRHNFGFMVLDYMAESNRLDFKSSRFKSETTQVEIGDEKVILVKPNTFMNLSGEAIQPLANFYKITPQDIFVIYDDLDLPLGRIRVAPKGGAAGHNGIKSLISHLGTPEFPRLKMGIGRPPGRMEVTNFVLSSFLKTEKKTVDELSKIASDVVVDFIKNGTQHAMNAFNGVEIIS